MQTSHRNLITPEGNVYELSLTTYEAIPTLYTRVHPPPRTEEDALFIYDTVYPLLFDEDPHTIKPPNPQDEAR